MSWNYRVGWREVDGEIRFAIHEAYYDGDSVSLTVRPVTFEGESVDDLRVALTRALQAIKAAKICGRTVIRVSELEKMIDGGVDGEIA